MSAFEDLRRDLEGEPPEDRMAGFELARRVSDFIDTAPRSEVLSLFGLLNGPLAMPGGFHSPHADLVMSIVRRYHEPDVLPLLEQAETECPLDARAQIVRSTFEVAAINEDEQALLSGLDMARRLVRDEAPIEGLSTPLYWLETTPIFPRHVLPALRELAAYPPLADHAERVRQVYAATYPDADAPSSFVSEPTLREWAESKDDQLIWHVISHVAALESAAGAVGYETVVALPDVLWVPSVASAVESEVLNGGYNQYFWNSSGRFAGEAVDAFVALGSDAYASVQRDANAAFIAHESDLESYWRRGTLEALGESYELRIFDHVDDAFVSIHATTTVTELLSVWLGAHIDELIAALGQRA